MKVSKGAVTLGNFSCNLNRNFIAPLPDKLHAMLPSVTPLRNTGKHCCSVAKIVAKSRTDFYFSQRLWHQKSCETCSFQRMLHWVIFPATCIAITLRDKLQKILPIVTLRITHYITLPYASIQHLKSISIWFSKTSQLNSEIFKPLCEFIKNLNCIKSCLFSVASQ